MKAIYKTDYLSLTELFIKTGLCIFYTNEKDWFLYARLIAVKA